MEEAPAEEADEEKESVVQVPGAAADVQGQQDGKYTFHHSGIPPFLAIGQKEKALSYALYTNRDGHSMK